MKKHSLIKCMGGVLALFLSFSLIQFGCSNASDGNGGGKGSNGNETNVAAKTLKQAISETPKNGTLDLGTIEVNIKDSDSYTINKAITIKNGNVKGGTFIVERSGVKFENISNIEAITVDEKVGSGDFTIKGCHEVGNLWVNGGGSNSIHIGNSSISRLILNKPLVRIALEASSEGNVKIQHAIIGQECKIESESGNTLENVIVANESAKVELAGTMKITNLVAQKSESVTKESGITISKENASLSDTQIDETFIDEAIKTANENLSDNTSLVKQDVPNGQKNLQLTSESCDDGILIKIANPPKATIESADYFMRVFIDGVGSVCQQWYNIYNDAPKEFFFPYVQRDKTYKVRIRFDCERKDNGVTIWGESESLSWGEINVKANGGKGGDLMIVSPQEVISIDANGNFKLKAPEFAQEPSEFDWEMVVEPYEGQSWEVENSKGWEWLGTTYIPKSETNSTHSIYEYIQNDWAKEGTIEFIGIFPRIVYTRGKTVFEYRWPAVTRDLEPPIDCTRQKYSKLDTMPLKVKNIEERPKILLTDEQVYMSTYPIADCGSSQRKIRNGDEYTIDFSAKSTIDLEGSWMTLIYTKEQIDDDGNKFYGWWYYPAEDYWHERLEENPPVSENETLRLKKTITISRRNAKADEIPCILIYIKPKQYKSDLAEIPLKDVSSTITSSNVTITKE